MPTVNLSRPAYKVLVEIRKDLQNELGLEPSFSDAVLRLKKLCDRS